MYNMHRDTIKFNFLQVDSPQPAPCSHRFPAISVLQVHDATVTTHLRCKARTTASLPAFGNIFNNVEISSSVGALAPPCPRPVIVLTNSPTAALAPVATGADTAGKAGDEVDWGIVPVPVPVPLGNLASGGGGGGGAPILCAIKLLKLALGA